VTKEVFDRAASLLGLLVLSPLFAIVLLLVFLQDRRSPLFLTERAGLQGKPFRMVKIRSMIVGADRLGGTSSPSDDRRITHVGAYIRRFKIDELFQLWNVLQGEMSLVGPRPQTLEEVASYSTVEQGLLAAKPGITDFASIVFADEGEVLLGATNPGLTYRQLIRPWKSRLGLFYVEHRELVLDLQLILLTLVRIVAPARAMAGVSRLLARYGASEELVRVARRVAPLVPHAVPGMGEPFEE
jgi:lipopolysaccharide/colanic/teichoic acid biosynthesis glycosyltransferase